MASISAILTPPGRSPAVFSRKARHEQSRYAYFAAHRFYVTSAALLLLIAWSYFSASLPHSSTASSHLPLPLLRTRDGGPGSGPALNLDPRGDGDQCRRVHSASDKCAWVRSHCADHEDGVFSYLRLYYCTLSTAKPLALIIIILWLALLFSTVGIAASDFLCVDLSTLANSLGMSESLAGVTFLAFGNGSPDLFSTFAAMGSDSGSLAVGELFGAACFITAVVAGSMALVRPFRVARRSFVRDVAFFICAASFATYAISDGKLPLWQCVVMVVFYIFYVILVVAWHWHLGRKRKRQRRDLAARAHFHIHMNQELEIVGEHDGEDNDDPDMGHDEGPNVHGASNEDFETLERSSLHFCASPSPLHPHSSPILPPPSPVWKADAQGRDVENGDLFPNSNEEEAEAEAQASYLPEIQKNMRLNHALAGQRRRTINSIRPSLVGALEFRSVLNSLQKARNIQSHTYLRPREEDTARPSRISYDCDRGGYSTHPWSIDSSCSRAATLPDGPSDRRSHDNEHDIQRPLFHVNVKPPSIEFEMGDAANDEEQDSRQCHEHQTPNEPEMPRIDIQPPSVDILAESSDSRAGNRSQSQEIPDGQDNEQRTPPTALAPPITFTSASPSSPDAPIPTRKKEKPKLVVSTDMHLSPESRRNRTLSLSPNRSAKLSPSHSIHSVPWERERNDLEREREQEAEFDDQHLAPPTPSFIDSNFLSPGRDSRGTYSPLSPQPLRSPTAAPRSPKSPRSPRQSPRSPLRSPRSTRDAVRTPSPFALPQSGRPTSPLSPFPAYSDDGRSTVSMYFPDRELPIEATLPSGIVPPPESKRLKWWPRHILPAPYVLVATLFPTLYGWSDKSLWEKFLGIVSAPSVLVLTLTLPVVEPKDPNTDEPDDIIASASADSQRPLHDSNGTRPRKDSDRVDAATWRRLERSDSELPIPVSSAERGPAAVVAKEWSSWLLRLQLFTGPLFIAVVVWSNIHSSNSAHSLVLPISITLGVSIALCFTYVFYSKKYSGRDMPPYSRPLFALLGFGVSIAWISTLSQEIVNALKTIGVILSISDSLLGLTVFACGNSIGDLIANITVARLGHPVMALAACFGSPVLNILLGIGLGGIYVNFRPPLSTETRVNVSTPVAFHFDVSKTLLITGGAVLFNLVALLVCVPLNKWRLDRKIGLMLIIVWTVTTVVNVVIELTIEKESSSN